MKLINSITKTRTAIAFCGLSLLLSACAQDTPVQASKLHADTEVFEFTVTIENKSADTSLASALSPFVWDVNTSKDRIFVSGQTASNEIEQLAEDGAVAPFMSALTGQHAEPLKPGEKHTFTFSSSPGNFFSMAGMVVETNDVFLASQAPIALFDARNEPFSGEVTLALYDAGTEVNQEPGKGADQATRQSAANTGTAEEEPIQLVSERNDGFTYPDVATMYSVKIEAKDDHDHEEDDHEDHEEDHDHDEEGHDDDHQ